jgi:hypothetical protein
VIRDPLTRDCILQHLNPRKLSDLQTVLRLREFYGPLPDVDLKECYFERAWGFRKGEFWLAGWREMSVEELKRKVRRAHPLIDGGRRRFYPPCKVDADTLKTKDDIVRAFFELTYVPQGGVRDRCRLYARAGVGRGREGRGGSACGWFVSVVGVWCWS